MNRLGESVKELLRPNDPLLLDKLVKDRVYNIASHFVKSFTEDMTDQSVGGLMLWRVIMIVTDE